jgi:hypothetical protein
LLERPDAYEIVTFDAAGAGIVPVEYGKQMAREWALN